MQKPPSWMFDKILICSWIGLQSLGCFNFKSIWISKVTTDNLLLGKTKQKELREPQNCWTKMLLSRTNSWIFETCIKISYNINFQTLQSNVRYYHWNISKHTSRRCAFYLAAMRICRTSLVFHRLHLVMFCVIITNIWWEISNSYIARE